MYLFFGDFLAGAPYQKKNLVAQVSKWLWDAYSSCSPVQDDAVVLSKTAVPPGSLWFLKGAARVHTVMALVIYLVKHTNCTLQVRGLDKKFSWQTAMWLMLAPCIRCGPWKEYCRGYWPLALQDLVCDPVQAHAFAKQASGAVPSRINVHEIVAFTIPK